MAYRLLVMVLVVLLPNAPLAQPAFVQSGEHEDFSRLVTKVPNGKSWRLEREQGKATLSFTNYREGFDTSRVFDFIPNDRVQQVSSDQDSLVIFLGCECDVTAFAVQGGHVAIDIATPQDANAPVLPTGAGLRPPTSLPNRSEKAAPPRQIPFGPAPRTPLPPRQISILADVQANLLRELGGGRNPRRS